MTAAERRSIHVLVRGRVQGVGFRAFVERTASALGLEGWVRNRRDGAVEVFAEGPIDRIEAFLRDLERGPTMSRVDALEPLPMIDPGPEGRGFAILPYRVKGEFPPEGEGRSNGRFRLLPAGEKVA